MSRGRMCVLMMAGLLLPELSVAQSFPGRIDDALVGDWACDGQRLFVTRLGSIEIIGTDYAAGLYDAADGVFAIEWDEGGQDNWSYRATSGGVVFTLPNGQDLLCAPRN